MENGPFIDGLPGFTVLKNGWIFPWQTVSHNQMVNHLSKVFPSLIAPRCYGSKARPTGTASDGGRLRGEPSQVASGLW